MGWQAQCLTKPRSRRPSSDNHLFFARRANYNHRMTLERDKSLGLCGKIARLVQERGWNQEEFARLANLHRLTARQILQGPERRLHNATVGACARALGLGVGELRTQPLERLVGRMRQPASASECTRRLYEEAMQPELQAWLERNPERAAQFSPDEIDEILSLQGTGGPLTSFGVNHFVEQIERRRRLQEKVAAVAGTEYLEFLEQFVEMLYERIQPYRNRGMDDQAAEPSP